MTPETLEARTTQVTKGIFELRGRDRGACAGSVRRCLNDRSHMPLWASRNRRRAAPGADDCKGYSRGDEMEEPEVRAGCS